MLNFCKVQNVQKYIFSMRENVFGKLPESESQFNVLEAVFVVAQVVEASWAIPVGQAELGSELWRTDHALCV